MTGAAASHSSSHDIRTMQWLRAAAIGFSIAFVIIAVESIRYILSQPKTVDFVSYWAAARLVVTDRINSVYDVSAHRLVELTVAPVQGLLPFPYPPPFLLVVTPFGLMPYPVAFACWLAVTYALFVAAAALVQRRKGLLPFALSNPGVLANFLSGQNGLLTSSLFMAGAHLLDRNPIRGGAILGLLVIKPQLAIAIPFALLAGREWKAIAGAAMSAIAALGVAGVLLGFEAYQGFFNILPIYTGGLTASRWPWNELASPFASMRAVGIPQSFALAIHSAIALAAIIVTCRAWRNRSEHRAATLAAATMLIPPYLLTYDCLFLVLPMLVLAREGRNPLALGAIWVLSLLPVATYFKWYLGPNTIPLAALLCIWMLNAPFARPRTQNVATVGS